MHSTTHANPHAHTQTHTHTQEQRTHTENTHAQRTQTHTTKKEGYGATGWTDQVPESHDSLPYLTGLTQTQLKNRSISFNL